MIAEKVVAEIRRLLRSGSVSQRAIARRVGVSRGTVGAIALGRRGDRETFSREDDDSPADYAPAGPPRRCPGCGGLVFMPCLLCRLRATSPRRAAREGNHSRTPASPPKTAG